MRKLSLLIIVVVACCACDRFYTKHQVGTVVEVNGQSLYMSDLAAITRGLRGEDSAQAADAYIRQWATEILLYDKARARDDKQLEALVEDYRRSLYVHQYEQQLINHYMPRMVMDAQVDTFYATHRSEYVLEQPIAKGILVITPLKSPDQAKVIKWIKDPKEENLEKLEKYCYRYSSGYQLFLDNWVTASQLQLWFPSSAADMLKRIRPEQNIVYEDSVSTYILQLSEVCAEGAPMPIDYARPQIEKVLLHDRQISFIEMERNKLFDEAVRFNKVKLYEN